MAKSYNAYPETVIEPGKKYTARLNTTKGTIELELYADRAPKTVNNFVFLAKDGFYDDVIFHRVIPNFMVQGGDPTGTGTSGPGYEWNDEPSALQIPHEQGVISMANRGANTNGSQFFITHVATPHLNGKHAVFGKVTGPDSQAVVDSIQVIDPQRPSGVTPDKITSVEIIES